METPKSLIPVIICTGLNILAFVAFAYDKLQAKANMWRTPERTLMLISALGSFGALAAMKGFRYKTLHMKFYLVPFFAILHVVLIAWLSLWFFR